MWLTHVKASLNTVMIYDIKTFCLIKYLHFTLVRQHLFKNREIFEKIKRSKRNFFLLLKAEEDKGKTEHAQGVI